jgi:hypothetical protein
MRLTNRIIPLEITVWQTNCRKPNRGEIKMSRSDKIERPSTEGGFEDRFGENMSKNEFLKFAMNKLGNGERIKSEKGLDALAAGLDMTRDEIEDVAGEKVSRSELRELIEDKWDDVSGGNDKISFDENEDGEFFAFDDAADAYEDA